MAGSRVCDAGRRAHLRARHGLVVWDGYSAPLRLAAAAISATLYYGAATTDGMVRPVAMLVALVLVVPIAAAGQTYDTPATLVVSFSHPTYMYVDPDGYAIVTGIIQNESKHSYMGNVQVLARFYDSSGMEPLYISMATALLDAIPPESSSPFVIKSAEPDPRVSWATASILLFDATDPKVDGIGLEVSASRGADGAEVVITASDISESPHTNVRVHIAYHDAFEPPRILKVTSHEMPDIGIGGAASIAVADEIPQNVRGFIVFAESDSSTSGMASGTLPAPVESGYLGPAAYIREAWLSDADGERTVELERGQDVTINASIEYLGDDDGDHMDESYWMYLQIKRLGDPVVVSVERAEVTPRDDVVVSVPWSPSEEGQYFMEMFLWGDLNVPVAEPGPLVLFLVR